MIEHNKLVRDKIPEIIEKSGKKCTVSHASPLEYQQMLDAKLQEELHEYLNASGLSKIEELADLVEVVYAILDNQGIFMENFEEIRLTKRRERGGFDLGLILKSVSDQ